MKAVLVKDTGLTGGVNKLNHFAGSIWCAQLTHQLWVPPCRTVHPATPQNCSVKTRKTDEVDPATKVSCSPPDRPSQGCGSDLDLTHWGKDARLWWWIQWAATLVLLDQIKFLGIRRSGWCLKLFATFLCHSWAGILWCSWRIVLLERPKTPGSVVARWFTWFAALFGSLVVWWLVLATSDWSFAFHSKSWTLHHLLVLLMSCHRCIFFQQDFLLASQASK